MIMGSHRPAAVTRLRLGSPGLRGLGQSLPNFNNDQWYELIALASNHPLADTRALYSQTAAGSNLTNLQIALGQWPGGIAHTAYLAYSQGNIVDAVQGGHYFQYGGAWAGLDSQLGYANRWAVPAQQPTTQQVLAATTAMFGQYRQAMSAPVYSQNQNAAAVIAAYNAANPQAPVAVQAAAPTTSTTQQQTTSSVQAGSTATTTTSGSTATIGNFLTGTLVDSIPNWMLLGGGALGLFLVMQLGHGRR